MWKHRVFRCYGVFSHPRAFAIRYSRLLAFSDAIMRLMHMDCDCGESYGAWTLGIDATLLQYVTSAMWRAAGMQATGCDAARCATACEAKLWRAPATDLTGFGRRSPMTPGADHEQRCWRQVSAAGGGARSGRRHNTCQATHGALYNDAAVLHACRSDCAGCCRSIDQSLLLVGLADQLIKAGRSGRITRKMKIR